jgi:hypothetical protein
MVAKAFTDDCGLSGSCYGDCGLSGSCYGDCGLSGSYYGDCGLSGSYYGDCSWEHTSALANLAALYPEGHPSI